MQFASWLQSFVTWLRNLVGPAKYDRPPYVLKQVSADGKCALYLLHEDGNDFPGVVSVWQVEHVTSENSYLLILCNLAQIRESLQSGQVRSGLLGEWQRVFEIKCRVEIKAQRHIMGSHLFLLASLTKEPVRSRWVNGQLQRFRYLDFVSCCVCNLQRHEYNALLGENRDAALVVKAIALRLLRTTPSQYVSWEEIIWGINWVEWLSAYAKLRFGEAHVLQPPRTVR